MMMRLVTATVVAQLAIAAVGAPTVDAIEAALAEQDAANDRAWTEVRTPAELSTRLDAFRAIFRQKVGFDRNAGRGRPAHKSLGVKSYDGFRIEKVLLEGAPGAFITALVFLPDEAKFAPPYAGYMFIPGHSNSGKSALPYLQSCELGARNGLAAIVYDPLGQGERSQGAKLVSADEHVRIGAYATLVGETTAKYMLQDAECVFDYFANRKDVDASRLGVCGNSGGGTMSAYFMVLEDRVKAAVPSCYLSSAREHLLACGPQDNEQNFFDGFSWGFNHAALILSARRPVLINAAVGDFFQIEGSRSTHRLVSSIARQMKLPEVALSEAPGKHTMSRMHREKAVSFFLKHLKGEEREVHETVTNLFVEADWTVTPKGEVSALPGFKPVYDTIAEKFAAQGVCVENAAINARGLVRQELAGDDCQAVLATLKGEIAKGKRATLHLGGAVGADETTVTLFADGARFEPRKERKGKRSYYERRGGDEVVAVDLYLAGRSLAALRAAELLKIAAELERQTGLKPKLVAEGRYTVPAKFAIAADAKAFAEVVYRNEPKPWIESLKAREYLSFSDTGAIYSGERHEPKIDPLTTRWTFGAHEPMTMYRRMGRRSTGAIDGNALWTQDWLNWFDDHAPEKMREMGFNWIHSRFYKGMGWEVEKKDFPNVRKFVRNCHANGVKTLAYVQFGSLYPEMMRREIPQIDDWCGRNLQGEPNTYFANYFRWMPCLTCREWEDYLKRMCTIALTEGEFDGIMFDNVFDIPCYCKRCEKEFRKWMGKQENTEERFGLAHVDDVMLPRVSKEKLTGIEVRDPVLQAWLVWRCETMTGVMTRLREHIKSVKPDAVVSGNPAPYRSLDDWQWKAHNMIELSETFDAIVMQNSNYPEVKGGRIFSRVRDFKFAQDLGQTLIALCDNVSNLYSDREKKFIFPMMEDVVFGGIPTDRTSLFPSSEDGFVNSEVWNRRKPIHEKFNEFAKANRKELSAPTVHSVRIFYPEREVLLSTAAHQGIAAAEEIFLRNRVPFGYLISYPDKPLEVPADTEVVVVPGVTTLSDRQIDELVALAKSGMKMVVTGDAGRYNEWNAQRRKNTFLPRLSGLANVVCRENADLIPGAKFGWRYVVNAPKDGGKALMADLQKVGWKMPVKFAGLPPHVLAEYRRMDDGTLAVFLLNYMPEKPISGAKAILPTGKQPIADFVECSLLRIKN